MDNIVWFIDGCFGVSETVMEKLICLAKPKKSLKSVKIIIDKRFRGFERSYWLDFSEKAAALDKHNHHIKQLLSYITKELNDHHICHDIILEEKSSVLSALLEASNKESSLLVVEDQERKKRHMLFQCFDKIPSHILLLTQLPWDNAINIVAAIDPLHENTRPEDVDARIIAKTVSLAKHFKGNWKAVHCCFIAPILQQHKNIIQATHKEGVEDFLKLQKISKEKAILLNGNPEDILPHFITDNTIHLLVLGLIARNKFKQAFIGSTTISLLDQPPCDMLLIRTSRDDK